VYSSLTYVVGAAGNVLGGFAGDWLAKRHGLRSARRSVGVAGLGFAALFFALAISSSRGTVTLAFISLAYGSYLFQQPNFCALCLDVGRKNAGAVFGIMNTAASAAAALCAAVFGTIVSRSGNYDLPFIPMIATLCVGAYLWMKVDPVRELFPEAHPPLFAAAPLPATAD
jgi:ACS family glucarate transporter-like MFS transporter